jgi:hypothetical protein
MARKIDSDHMEFLVSPAAVAVADADIFTSVSGSKLSTVGVCGADLLVFAALLGTVAALVRTIAITAAHNIVGRAVVSLALSFAALALA